jgi:hypothetical protein
MGDIAREVPKEPNMEWVFETYSNVYKTAMMQDVKTHEHAATAKKTETRRWPSFLGRHGFR